jgi:ubiquinol-cytochrome c reductase cytochrome b subunit
VIGTWVAFLLFGGEFPAHDILSRLFVIHVLLVPAAIAILLTAHLAIVWRQKHTQFAGPGRTERNVVGSKLWPTYTAKSVGLFAVIAGVLALLGGLAQINPVWLYGPFAPSAVSTAAQPDWYLGWIEGALRIMPPVYLHLGPYNVSELFWPAIALPTITFGLLFLWPFLEQRMTHDHREHHILDRPSERPVRTALGVVVLTFYAVLLLAGGQDIWAQQLDVSLSAVLWTFRVLVFVLPVVFGAFTYKFCRDLERHRHAARAAAAAEPPIGPNEPPPTEVSRPTPAAAPAPATPGRFDRLRRTGFGVVILFVLRRAAARRERVRR